MGCDSVHLSDGFTGVVCSRGRSRKKCKHCKHRRATKLCDYPLSGKHYGKTCDFDLCDSCAVKQANQGPFPGTLVGDTIDLCPAHARLVKAHGWPKPVPRRRPRKRVPTPVPEQEELFK